MILKVAVLSVLVTASRCTEDLNFPPWFKFGSASSSYQVEGAWNASDKSENIWDRFTHVTTGVILDGSNGDEAADSYNQWRRDIEMIEEMGLQFYRFSISWSRLLPTGFSNYVSEDGKDYYNNLIDGLLEKGVEPVVTLFHFDLPQKIQDLGGWTNPLITEWFADYVRVVYSLYADRVKTWITINEPVYYDSAYKTGMMAPGVIEPDFSAFLCTKHAIISHAKAWRIYDEEFKPKYHGKVSITNQVTWMVPNSEEDEELSELVMQMTIGIYSHPIYSKEGGWPPAIEKIIEEDSIQQGHARSRLPPFTEEEIDLVKGTYDFYGVNYYTSRLIRPAGEEDDEDDMENIPELHTVLEMNPIWPVGFVSVFPVYPEGLRYSLAWLKKTYGDVEILITENGYSSAGAIEDEDRIVFIKDHLKQILLSIKEDGVNVTGYSYWSLMDSFEWSFGYGPKFGLYEVDFNSPLRTRTPRASAHYYKTLIQNHSLDMHDPSLINTLPNDII